MTTKTIEIGNGSIFSICLFPDGSADVTVDDYHGQAFVHLDSDEVRKLKDFLEGADNVDA